ncbi:MAG: class I SAM-dependent methyltransferase [Anaerolineales bacterium]|nr:class I SAM-dependent methyltransferase [Anaerolineales bacterium]
MAYFDDPRNVQNYITMAAGYDGRELVTALGKYFPDGAEVLELGMGPGVDLDLLSQQYQVTGSDTSRVFLDRYRKNHPGADLLLLDAETIETSRRFAGLYSNKVLHHLSSEQLQASFLRQQAVLLPEGIALHSFWLGDGEEFMDGLRFRCYSEDYLHALVEPNFTILESTRYKEFEADDSLYLILKKI